MIFGACARLTTLASACVLGLMATVPCWSQSLTWLGTLPGGSSSYAYGVSADGRVVVGLATNPAGWSRAFRWTAAGGIQDLGTLGGDSSNASGVSADGRVVVGGAENAARYLRAFRWTQVGGMVDLSTLSVGYSVARGVSADGRVVVGGAENAVGRWRALRWTEDRVEDLGTLGGRGSMAYGISADGRAVVGRAENAAGNFRAFRWTASGRMQDLNAVYARLLTDGSVLEQARAISPDGRYIAGWGFNAATRRLEAFLLDTGFPLRGDVDRNGCVDDADLQAVLLAFGEQGYRNEDINWDGIVNDADLLEVLFNFGSGC